MTPYALRASVRLSLETIVALLVSSLVGNAFGHALSRTAGWQDGAIWERAMLGWFHAHRLPRAFDILMLAIPYTGTNLTMLPVSLAMALWLWRWRGRGLLALQLSAVTVGSLLLNATLKWQLGRERPDLFPGRGIYRWSSYPSGHAIFVTAFYFTIALVLHRERGWRWPLVLALLIVLLNCGSRLYLYVHWPTDLIGGLLTGMVWLLGSWTAFQRFEHSTATMAAPEPRASLGIEVRR